VSHRGVPRDGRHVRLHVATYRVCSMEQCWVQRDGESVRVGLTDSRPQTKGGVALVECKPTASVLAAGEDLAKVETIRRKVIAYSFRRSLILLMKERLAGNERAETMPPAGATVEIFDPPMCCSTGLCGPTVDQALLDLNEMILTLKAEGVGVERYQMSTNPNAFLANADVMRLVREQEMAVLPITAVRGKVVKIGAYPS